MRNHQWVYSSSESQPIAKVQLLLIFVAYLTKVLLLQGTRKEAWKVRLLQPVTNMSILESESESESESQPIAKVQLSLIFVAYLTEVLLLQGTRKGARKVIKK